MQRKFITNLAFLLFLNLLIKPFWIFGIDREVQNTVGAGSYGLYAALFNFTFLFNILLDLGITNYNNRHISQHNFLLNKYFSGILVLRLFLAGIYFLISVIVALALGYRGSEILMLLVLLFNQALLSFILYLRSNLAGLHLFKTDSIISVLDRLIMIVTCGILLWGNITDGPFQIEWFIWTQTSAYVLTAFITFCLVAAKADAVRLEWNPKFLRVVLKNSYPYAILILLMAFYNRIDSVMLERLLPEGPTQAGIYAQAYRLLDAANMIAFLFAGLLLPMFSHMIKRKQPMEELISLSFSFIAVPAVIVISFCLFHSFEVMDMLYDAHVEDSAAVLQLVISCFLAISSVYIFGTVLTANGNLRQLNKVALSGMLLNVILNLFLIPRYEARGAAVSSIITQYLTAGLQVLLAHQVFGFRFRWNLLMRYILFTGGTLWFFSLTEKTGAGWMLAGLIASAGSLLLAFSLMLIRPRELLRHIRAEEA